MPQLTPIDLAMLMEAEAQRAGNSTAAILLRAGAAQIRTQNAPTSGPVIIPSVFTAPNTFTSTQILT